MKSSSAGDAAGWLVDAGHVWHFGANAVVLPTGDDTPSAGHFAGDDAGFFCLPVAYA